MIWSQQLFIGCLAVFTAYITAQETTGCDCSKRIISNAKIHFAGKPPSRPSESLLCAYTRCGQIPLLYEEKGASLYVDDTMGGAGVRPKYSRNQIDRAVTVAGKSLKLVSSMPSDSDSVPAMYRIALTIHRNEDVVRGKDCLIIGSNSLTVESLLLAAGAQHIIVMEYNKGKYDHPSIRSWKAHNWTFPEDFQPSAIFAFGALNHDGLGRYGDPLSPDADLKFMDDLTTYMQARAPSAKLFLTVPLGRDVVAWNMHRRYGRIRFPLLIQSFQLLNSVAYSENMLDANPPIMQSVEPILILQLKELKDAEEGVLNYAYNEEL